MPNRLSTISSNSIAYGGAPGTGGRALFSIAGSLLSASVVLFLFSAAFAKLHQGRVMVNSADRASVESSTSRTPSSLCYAFPLILGIEMQPGAKECRLKAILFDVGNTLVFPNRQITLRPMHDRGFFPAERQIKLAETVARRTLDDQLLTNGAVSVDRGYWEIYYETLLREAGIDDHHLKSELATLSGQSGNWSILAENTKEVLASLRQNYALGIVSNSDGRLSALLARLGIDPFFECVIASSVVGYEKPHKRIFEIALERLGVKAEQAVYAGDIYSVDYLGATGAGIPAVLIDVYDVYNQVDVPRVTSLRELHKLIQEREWLR